jgi:hypothetical protein
MPQHADLLRRDARHVELGDGVEDLRVSDLARSDLHRDLPTLAAQVRDACVAEAQHTRAEGR